MNPKQRIVQTLLAAIPEETHPELARFTELLRDYPQREGKTFRGLLVLAATEAFGGTLTPASYTTAAAIELFQNWALIHDDIVDESETRRGAPSLHRVAGMPLALNAGDALHGLMWEMLLNMDIEHEHRRLDIMREFTRITWTTASGQHLDLVWSERPQFAISDEEYFHVVSRKTAYYTVVGPLRLGAYLANQDAPKGLNEAAEALGIAFQLHDDLLDLTSEESTGKQVGGDLYESKRTLLLSYALGSADDAHRARVEALLSKPRGEKTAADVLELIRFIENSGAPERIAELSQQYETEGIAGVQRVLEPFNNAAVPRMLASLKQVTSRSN